MAFKDGRGVEARKFKAAQRSGNVKRVKDWLAKNPDGTPSQCARDLELSRPTIYSISKELREAKE